MKRPRVKQNYPRHIIAAICCVICSTPSLSQSQTSLENLLNHISNFEYLANKIDEKKKLFLSNNNDSLDIGFLSDLTANWSNTLDSIKENVSYNHESISRLTKVAREIQDSLSAILEDSIRGSRRKTLYFDFLAKKRLMDHYKINFLNALIISKTEDNLERQINERIEKLDETLRTRVEKLDNEINSLEQEIDNDIRLSVNLARVAIIGTINSRAGILEEKINNLTKIKKWYAGPGVYLQNYLSIEGHYNFRCKKLQPIIGLELLTQSFNQVGVSGTVGLLLFKKKLGVRVGPVLLLDNKQQGIDFLMAKINIYNGPLSFGISY